MLGNLATHLELAVHGFAQVLETFRRNVSTK
jgi:hypothetical protein